MRAALSGVLPATVAETMSGSAACPVPCSPTVRLRLCDRPSAIWSAAADAAMSITVSGEVIRPIVLTPAMATSSPGEWDLVCQAGPREHCFRATSCLPCTGSESTKVMTAAAAEPAATAAAETAAVAANAATAARSATKTAARQCTPVAATAAESISPVISRCLRIQSRVQPGRVNTWRERPHLPGQCLHGQWLLRQWLLRQCLHGQCHRKCHRK